MSENRKLADNVWAFLDRACTQYGKIAAERFSQDTFCELLENGVESPIEDLFFIACKLHCYAAFFALNPGPSGPDDRGVMQWSPGLYITPQAKIGKFRVDFHLWQSGIGPDEILTPVVVELDGHDFHDRDKHQRSYEKARDRFLVREGLRVVHFTGSDVVADPLMVAFEVLEMLGVFSGSGRREYDPTNPLGYE